MTTPSLTIALLKGQAYCAVVIDRLDRPRLQNQPGAAIARTLFEQCHAEFTEALEKGHCPPHRVGEDLDNEGLLFKAVTMQAKTRP